MFHQTALDELGDDTVSARNIVEFFSIVLGQHLLYQEMLDSMPDGYDQNDMVWEPTLHVAELRSDKWDCVPIEVALAMRAHSRVGTPWSIARHELPLDLTDEQVTMLGKVYRNNRNKEMWKARHVGPKTAPKLFESDANCVVCGARFVAKQRNLGAPKTKTCSKPCRLEHDKRVRKARVSA